MNKHYLFINRVLVAALALVAIWSDTPVSEVAASVSTLLWVFMTDAIKFEKKCCSKLKRAK